LRDAGVSLKQGVYVRQARGSLRMFNHLMKKIMVTEWTYGPVTCQKLFLEGVDVPLDDNVSRRACHEPRVLLLWHLMLLLLFITIAIYSSTSGRCSTRS
jgi:hypothetical protein